jgi:hypothetical protein
MLWHKLIPVDQFLFLWYSSFWVQLQQLIPGPRLCPSTPATICTILVQRKFFRCNAYGPLLCVANKELTQYLSPVDATLTKNIGGGGHPSANLRSAPVPNESVAPVPILFLEFRVSTFNC